MKISNSILGALLLGIVAMPTFAAEGDSFTYFITPEEAAQHCPSPNNPSEITFVRYSKMVGYIFGEHNGLLYHKENSGILYPTPPGFPAKAQKATMKGASFNGEGFQGFLRLYGEETISRGDRQFGYATHFIRCNYKYIDNDGFARTFRLEYIY